MKASLKRMSSPGVAKNDTQEMMEEYVMQCEKAIQTGKKTDLPKRLQTKLEELQRDRENAALAKANSPPKTAETEPTPSTTTSTTIAKANDQKEKGKTSMPKEKREEEKDKQKHCKEQPVAISSDEESDSELMIEGQEENPQINAGTGPTAQTTSANPSVSPLEIDASLAEEIEQREQEAEEGEAEVSVPTPEESATAVVTTPTPTTDHTYSTTVSIPTPVPIPPTVSSSAPTPIPIYSTLTTTSPVPATIVPICDAITHIMRYALGQGPHPAMRNQQAALVQSTTSVQSPISSPMVSPPPPFKVHLDPADMEFLSKKAEDCRGKQSKLVVQEGKVNPYIKLIAVLEQSSREGLGTA